jgi:methylmalonyl-CoA/ethylmalonyl-CoA epimerase
VESILGAGARFHHVGLACRDMDREEAGLSALGYARVGAPFSDPRQGIAGLFLDGPGPQLELLAPLEGSSVLDPWLAGRAKMYHLAYEVPEFDKAIAAAQAAGGRIVSEPVPSVAFDGRRICFVMLRNLFLVELIESGEPQ